MPRTRNPIPEHEGNRAGPVKASPGKGTDIQVFDAAYYTSISLAQARVLHAGLGELIEQAQAREAQEQTEDRS